MLFRLVVLTKYNGVFSGNEKKLKQLHTIIFHVYQDEGYPYSMQKNKSYGGNATITNSPAFLMTHPTYM